MLDELELDDCDGDDSWFSWGGSATRTLSSGAIFLLSLVLLFWNEGSSKQQADALVEAAEQVREVGTTIDPALQGLPVHLSARVSSAGGVRDSLFPVRSSGVLLYRDVQMFQWIEYKETSGRGKRKRTEYYYEQDWDWQYHDSSKFHEPKGHENPKPRLEGDGFFAEDARLGPFRFNNKAIARQAMNEHGEDFPGSMGDWPRYVGTLPELPDSLTARGWFKAADDEYYLGDQSVEEIEVGDLSVTFWEFRSDYPLSVVAGQDGDQLTKWQASNGDTVLVATAGKVDAQQMISDAIANNSGARSMLRLVGMIGAMLGMAGMAGALGGFLSMIPVVGRLVDVSLRLLGALIGLLLGAFTILIGWLWARPIIAISLLLVVFGGIAWWIHVRRTQYLQQRRNESIAKAGALAKQRAAERAAMPPPPVSAPARSGPSSGAGSSTSIAPSFLPPALPHQAGSGRATEPDRNAQAPVEELAPLEWTPGLSTHQPPSVRPRPSGAASPLPPPYGSVADPDEPSFAPPLFEQVEARAPAAPPSFDRIEPRPAAVAAQAQAPLFETVRPAIPAPALRPAGDLKPAPTDAPDANAPLELLASARATPAAGVQAARPAATPANAAESGNGVAKMVRRGVGRKGDYSVNKILKLHLDGSEQLLCFELAKDGKALKRGSQEEIRDALRQALIT